MRATILALDRAIVINVVKSNRESRVLSRVAHRKDKWFVNAWNLNAGPSFREASALSVLYFAFFALAVITSRWKYSHAPTLMTLPHPEFAPRFYCWRTRGLRINRTHHMLTLTHAVCRKENYLRDDAWANLNSQQLLFHIYYISRKNEISKKYPCAMKETE